METINITKDFLQSLDETRKQQLKNKLSGGNLTINIIEDDVKENTEKQTPIIENEPVDFSKVEEPKQLKETPVLQEYNEEKKPFYKKIADFVVDTAKVAGSAAQDLLNVAAPIGEANFMGKHYDNPLTGIKGDEKLVDKISEDGDLPLAAYNKINKLSRTDISMISNKEEGVKTYNENLADVIINDLGFDDLYTGSDGKYYAIKGDEKIELNKSTFKDIVSSAYGDKMEMAMALYGAKKGYDSVKNFGTKAKFLGSLGGGAIGAMTGTVADMLDNVIETGEKLNAAQMGNEMVKSAVIDTVGNIAGAGLAKVVGGVGSKIIDTVKGFDLGEVVEKQVIDSFAKIPQEAREDTLKALQFAEENGIKLTPTDIVNHANLDQFVQVLARNSFIRNAIKDSEMKNQQALKDVLFKKIDELGDKASPEDIGAVVQQELKEAQNLREVDVRKAYEDFKQGVSGDYVVPSKSIKETFYKEMLERDGVRTAEQLKEIEDSLGVSLKSKEMKKDVDDIFSRLDLRASWSEVDPSVLNAKDLHEARKHFSEMENSLYDTNRMRSATYGKAKKLVDEKIDALASFEKDEVAQMLTKAKKLNIEKSNIYGISSKHTDIKNALDSGEPNKMIHTLLTGTNALDNANILNIELSKTKHGKELLGALGRKYLDDAFSSLDKLTATKASAILKNDQIEVSKRLLGKEVAEHIEQTQKLFSMMINTENLLKGTGAEIAAASQKGITTRVVDFVVKTVTRLAQYKMLGEFMLSDEPQKVLKNTLEKATKIRTEDDVVKFVDRNLRQLDYVARKKLNIDTSDIIDLKKAKEELRVKKQSEAEKQAAKEAEEQQKKELLQQEVENFQTPDISEIRSVARHTADDNRGSFSQMTVKIQNGTATPHEIETYVKAKNSIDKEVLEKEILKEKYPENGFSVPKLNDLKSFANEKVNEIISEDEFKSLIYNLDKHNKMAGTTTQIQEKYREKFYKLHKLYDEEKAIRDTFTEAQNHPKYQELINMRKDISAKDSQYDRKVVNKGHIVHDDDRLSGVDNTFVVPTSYERNYNADFKLTKQDIQKINNGKIDENLVQKIKDDLYVLDNHPDYKQADELSFEEAEKLGLVPFAKFGDNLVAGAAAGVETDEDGNIVGFDPEAFVLGLGGYTVAKAGAKKLIANYGNKIKENVAKKLDDFISSAEDDMAKMAGGGNPPVIEKDFKDNQGFYSVLEKTINEKVGGAIDTVSLTKLLEKNGVKQDELEWSGLKELLDTKNKLTKEEIGNTIKENRLALEVIEKGSLNKHNELNRQVANGEIDYKEFTKKLKENNSLYRKYKLDNGENYRELLFRMPNKIEAKLGKEVKIIDGGDGYYYLENAPFDGTNVISSAKSKATLENQIKKGYKSDHWDESNIVVFTRVDDRTIDNKKTLFIEELQSDWHQEGRKLGYGNRSPKVPNAPFKKNWHELGLKRMIQEAVSKDYDKIAWTTGKQQAQRYSLEKEIDTVVYNKESGFLQASKGDDEVIFKKVASDEEVANLLGKELTTRLINPKSSTRENIFVLKDEDVKFGGDGMKAFYNEIVPNSAKKLLKKYGIKPKMEELDDIEQMVWSVDITPEMKKDIKKFGQPLYVTGGAVAGYEILEDQGEENE